MPLPHRTTPTARRVLVTPGGQVPGISELNRFYGALLGGRLLPPTQLATLLNTAGTRGVYGLGIYPQKLYCGITVRGHNGHMAGSYVRAAATRDGRHTLTYRTDTDTLTDADTLQRALLKAEFCGRVPRT